MKFAAIAVSLAAAAFAAAAQQAAPPSQNQNPGAPPPTQTQPAAQLDPALQNALTEAAHPIHLPGSASGSATLATVSLEGVSLSGSLSIDNGLAFIGNNGAITAADQTVHVALMRGGSLNLCASTKVNLSTDATLSGGGLMIALDHGALEGHYQPGKYSDVVLTPDLRILISPPGQADFSVRVNKDGDTCIDNRGDHAPYVTASSLFEGGAYRIQPNQRVLFVRGSLQRVVDEQNPCGCPSPPPIPTPTEIAGVGAPGATLRSESQPTPPPPPSTPATPATTAAENPFPQAQSESGQPLPQPAAPPGGVQTQITVPLVYNGETAPNPGAPTTSGPGAAPGSTPAESAKACNDPLYPGVVCDSGTPANQAAPKPENPPAPVAPPPQAPKKKRGFIHFLKRIFGGS